MANYFKQLNEAFDKKYGLNNVVESKCRKLVETAEADWDWYEDGFTSPLYRLYGQAFEEAGFDEHADVQSGMGEVYISKTGDPEGMFVANFEDVNDFMNRIHTSMVQGKLTDEKRIKEIIFQGVLDISRWRDYPDFENANESFKKSKRKLREAKNDGIFSMTLSEYANSQGVDEKEAESWVTMHPEKTISKLYFSEDEESPYTGVVYTDGTISVVGARYDDDVKDFSTMRKVLLSGSEDIFESKRKLREAKNRYSDIPDSYFDQVYSKVLEFSNTSGIMDSADEILKDCPYPERLYSRETISDYYKAARNYAYMLCKLVISGRQEREARANINEDQDKKKVPLTSKPQSISSLLLKNKSAIDNADDLNALIHAVQDAISAKKQDKKAKEILAKLNTMQDHAKALTYIYNIILKGDNLAVQGRKKYEGYDDGNNEIDRYQKWVDFDMSRYGKISERTQQMVNKAGYQIIKDDHGDYEVAAGHFE